MTQSDPFKFLRSDYRDSDAIAVSRYTPMDFSPVADEPTEPDDGLTVNDSDNGNALAKAFERHNARIHANAYRYGLNAQ